MELSPNFKKMMGMAESLGELPTSAAGPKQKPVPEGFGWKPTEAQTAQDIANAKALEPLEREAFFKTRVGILETPKEIKPTIPSEDELTSMSWIDLLDLRRKAKTEEEQNRLAPYEHRAWAREYVKDNPEAALVMPGMIVAYNILKGSGALEGRSQAGPKAIAEGMKGWLEGIGGATREGVDKLLENYEELKKDLTWKPLPSAKEIWEEAKKNGTKIENDLKKK